MNKIVYILSFVFLSFCSVGQSLENVRVVNTLEEVKPGNYFSLFVEVNKNFHNSFPDNVSELKLPGGWDILSEKKLVKETGVRYMYTISTSKNSPSDEYFLEFGLFIRDKIIAYRSIGVVISENSNVEVIPLKKKEFVLEGDTLITPFLIQNLGNTSERVKLKTSRGTLNFDDLIIEANATKIIEVTQIIPFTDNSDWQVSSDLTILLDNKKSVYNVVTIPVYSNREKKIDHHLRLPIEVGISHANYSLGTSKFSAFQFNAQGRGFLDFKKNHFIDFLINTPNNNAIPNLGNYDQYSLSYRYKDNSSVILGDFSNRISNLLEFGRVGRGIKLEQKTVKSTFSVFYQKARFSMNQKSAFGGTFELQPKENITLTLNQINKKLIDKEGDFMSNLVSTSGYFKWKKLNIDAEVSFGLAKNKFDMALFVETNYTLGKLRFYNRTLRAGKDYHGFYTNSNFFMNSVNYRINNKINLGINSSFSRLNRSFDITAFSVSPLSKVHSAFFTYQVNSKHMLLINYTNQEREDRLEPSSYHYKEDFTNLTYNYFSPRLEFNLQARLGNSSNLLVSPDNQERRRSYGSTIQPLVTVLPWLKVGGYFEYQHTNKFSNDNNSQDLYYYGGNVNMNYKEFIRLNFMYRNNYAPDEFFEKRSLANVSLTFDFKNQSISLRGERSFSPTLNAGSQNTSFFSINYAIKLNPRVAKNKNIGHLGGKLVGDSDGIPKEGIMVKLGPYKTLTDSSGRFHFNNVSPDKYIFSIPATYELSGIKPEKKMPLEIDIVSDSTAYLEVPLVKTGGVSGELDFKITKTYDYKDENSKPLVLAKLTNGEETLVTSVNKNNSYSFKEVKPGDWLLTIYVPGNQDEYEILNNVSNIHIESSKVEMVNFTLRSVDRRIQNTGQQFHLTSSKKK